MKHNEWLVHIDPNGEFYLTNAITGEKVATINVNNIPNNAAEALVEFAQVIHKLAQLSPENRLAKVHKTMKKIEILTN